MKSEWMSQGYCIEMRSTDGYLKLQGFAERMDQIWHGLSFKAGRGRVVCVHVVGAEPGTMIEMLSFGADGEANVLAMPVPLELLDPVQPGVILPLVLPGQMVLVGLTRKAKAVSVGLVVETRKQP